MSNEMQNYVKDIEEKKNLQDNVDKEKVGDYFDFKKFDEDIEKSFQVFLNDLKDNLKGDETKDDLQRQFNEWLDTNLEKLDVIKESEIAQAIIKPTEFELVGFTTSRELLDLQDDVETAEKDNTEETVEIQIKGEDLKMKTFNKIDANEISGLFNENNFDREEELLDLLKTAETNRDLSSDQVKKFQRIIAKIDEDGNDDKDSRGVDKPLGYFGVDGKFGKDTLTAFKKYVEENPVERNPQPAVQPRDGNDNTTVTTEVKSEGDVNPEEADEVVTSRSPELDEYIRDINTNCHSLTADKAREIIDKLKDEEAIQLQNLETLTPEAAAVLAGFKGGNGIYLTGLHELSPDVLAAFMDNNSKCKHVQFQNGELIKDDDGKYIVIKGDDKKYNEITNELCNALIGNHVVEQNGAITQEVAGDRSDAVTQEVAGDRSDAVTQEVVGDRSDAVTQEVAGNLDGAITQEVAGDRSDAVTQEVAGDRSDAVTQEVAGNLDGAITQEIVETPEETPEMKTFKEQVNSYPDLTEAQAEEILSKLGGESAIHLGGLKEIKPEVAAKLADFEGENGIYLTGLEVVTAGVIQAFANNEKCKHVKFPNGELIKDGTNKYISINGEEYREITDELCRKLIGSEEIARDNTGGNVDRNNDRDNSKNNNKRADVQQQYEGLGYNTDTPEMLAEATSNEEAIQLLTKGSGNGVFFLARWFGARKHNPELSIVDENYEPTGQEKIDLNNLCDYLLACKDNPRDVFTKMFEGERDFGDNEALGNLYDLYRECKNDQNGTKKGAYLKKVMGLLENYFVRWVRDKNGNIVTTFKDMYNNELIGIKKDLEKKETSANTSLTEDERAQLEESGGTALEAVNTKKQLSLPSDNFTERKEKYGFDSDAETQFAMCLCDLNSDGRIDSVDMSVKTGQELFNLIKDAKVDQKHGILEKGPMYNILSFATIKAEQDGHTNTAEFLKGINLEGTDEEIINKIKERPITMQYLRYMLINSPINMANNIIRYGGVKVETQEESDIDLELDADTQEAINTIMSNEKFDEIYENAYQQLIDQGLKDDETIKAKLRPIIALALFESSGSYMGGVSGGVDWNLGNAGDIAFMLGVGYGPDGNIMLGVTAAYGKSWHVGKHEGSIISVGLSGGFNFAEGSFVPMVIGSVGFDQMVNRNKLEHTLQERAASFVGANVNGGLLGGIPVRGVGLSYSQDQMKGINTTYESIQSDLGNVLEDVLKEKWPDTEDKTEIRTQMIASIKTALESRFGKTSDEELDRAAQSIYQGISYYLTGVDNPSQISEEQKIAIIEQVAENYANQRRNEKLSDLNGTTKFERFGIGLEFLAGYWPIPIASISFKKYGNLSVHETNQSMENYYKRLSSGEGMAYIDNSVSKEGADEGYITDESVTYLNDKLRVLSPNGNVPQITRVENGDKYDLRIPRDLCKYVNICHSPELVNYIKFDESSNSFLVPANIKLGLLTYSRTNEGKYNLILGDFSRGEGFEDLYVTSTPEGDTSNYEGVGGELKITESSINDKEEMKQLFNMDDFPLSECIDSRDGKVYFKGKTGLNIVVDGSGKIGLSERGILSIPEYGILKITKKEDGTYTAEFDDSINDKLSIQYIDVVQVQNSKREFDLDSAFDQYEELNNMFDGIEDKLSKLDDAQRNNYASFMDAASNAGIDSVLDENDYGIAFENLKTMLGRLTQRDLRDTNLSNLKQKIDEGNLSPKEKVLIVDRFKMLFSYDISLTDGQNDGRYLSKTLAPSRRYVYETLKGYNGEVFPLSGHYRDRIVDRLKDEPSLAREQRPGLIGMTAFYKYRKGARRINEGRGYSMTEMGSTTVLGGVYEELTDEASKNRFLSNLERSDAHKSILSEVITKKIQAVPGLENITINNDQIVALLRGEELDISGKKFTIETKYMFYLLGECGNESIGVNLEKIIIKGVGDGWTGTATVEIAPETTYENASGISIDGVASENRVNIGSTRSQTYGIAVGNAKPDSGYGAQTNQEGGTPENPNGGTTGQEGGGGTGNGGGGSGGGNGGGSGGGNGGGNGSGGGGSGSGNGGGGRP